MIPSSNRGEPTPLESSNFLQVGRMTACGHCNCECICCICHDKVPSIEKICGQIIHVGMEGNTTCANPIPCFMHDPEEHKKWMAKFEKKDDPIQKLVEEFSKNHDGEMCPNVGKCKETLAALTEAYEAGLRENIIRTDKEFAESIAKGTDEASKFMREQLLAEGRAQGIEEAIQKVEKLRKDYDVGHYEVMRSYVAACEAAIKLLHSLSQEPKEKK